MEDTSSVHDAVSPAADGTTSLRKRRRVSIFGVAMRLLVALGILAGIGLAAFQLVQSRPDAITRQPRERTFTVTVAEPSFDTFNVTFRAFGEVIAGRDIAIRAQVQGEVIEVSPKLDIGNVINQGELMLAVDSFDYDGALLDARAALADANLSLAEAQENLKLTLSKLVTAKTSLAIAQKDLERALSLNASGSLTDKDVETRQLALNERAQSVTEFETTIFSQNANIDRQRATIINAQSNVDEARRNLANTRIVAPFTGVVISETVGLGGYVTANESIISLYDPENLQVSFTISDLQYGNLLSGGIEGRAVTATWDIEPEPVTVEGQITRSGAEVNSATGGVTLFAQLAGENASKLRPGTFVEVRVAGPAFEQTLRLPETAIYENDHLYVVREGRMAKIDAEVLTRDNEMLIVRADVPDGERIITTRLSQAGEGVKVAVEGETPAFTPGQRSGGNAAAGSDAGASGGNAGARGAGGGLPPGAERLEDGSIKLRNGAIRRPDGSVLRPDGTVISAEEAAQQRGQRGGGQGGRGN